MLNENSIFEDQNISAEMEAKAIAAQIQFLKSRITFYQQETSKMELVFEKLKVLAGELKMFEELDVLHERLCQLQQKLKLQSVTPNTVGLSYAQRLRKHNHYSSKLKICLKMYCELNAKLSKKVKSLSSYYDQAQKNIEQLVAVNQNEEIQAMEKKIGRYEQELIKLEKKYPWLKSNDYDLPNINKEIKLLLAARIEKEQLSQELSQYGGLKPDIVEACDQLEQIKGELAMWNEKLVKQ